MQKFSYDQTHGHLKWFSTYKAALKRCKKNFIVYMSRVSERERVKRAQKWYSRAKLRAWKWNKIYLNRLFCVWLCVYMNSFSGFRTFSMKFIMLLLCWCCHTHSLNSIHSNNNTDDNDDANGGSGSGLFFISTALLSILSRIRSINYHY